MYILFKCLFFLPLLLISSSNASKRPFTDTQDNGDLSVTEKFGIGFNVFHGSRDRDSESDSEPDSKPEDGGSDTWYHKASFGFFGGSNSDSGSDKSDFETNYLGSWKLDNPNVGVEAMQLQLMPNDKVIWFDTTALGPSALQMFQPPNCPKSLENPAVEDCFSHAVEYDIETAKVRPLKLESDPWCSSGVLAPNGDLVVTGGYNKGIRAVRIISPTPNSEFKETLNVTASDRWYPSNAVLDDGSFIIIGGRNVFDYEILPPDTMKFQQKLIGLQFLSETTDKTADGHPIENNLYPFIFLLPDGNTLIFANNRSIIIEPRTGKLIRELPVLPGGARNYPATGSAVLLPLELGPDNSENVEVQMLVCGGNSHEAFILVDNVKEPQRVYAPALKISKVTLGTLEEPDILSIELCHIGDCGRISVTKEDAKWEIEKMPSPRVLGDMFILPNGQVLIINGAKKGTAGWEDADDANLTPVLYNPSKPSGNRFKELAPTTIPRMYHSAGAVLPDGKILLAGSNPHSRYIFNAKYNTELRVEKFDPPYLDPALSNQRPVIIEEGTDKKLKYGENFYIHIKLDVPVLDASILKVTMYAPPFTTHAFSMNQRQIVLKIEEIANNLIKTVAPPSGKIAPPGYYLIFVVHRGVPSKGSWVQIIS